MVFTAWLRSLKFPAQLTCTARRNKRRSTPLVAIERLEDRTLLSALTFSTPLNLSNTPDPQDESDIPLLAADGTQNVFALWKERELISPFPSTLFFSASNDGGQSFSTAVELTPNFDVVNPQALTSESGTLYAMWGGFPTGGGQGTFLANSNDLGATFSAPVQIPKPAASSGGWGDLIVRNGILYLGGSFVIQVGPGDFESDVYFTRSTDGGATFETPVNVSNSTLDQSRGLGDFTIDGAGNVHVTWNDSVVINETKRATELISTSSDGGVTFSTPVETDWPRNVRSSRLAAGGPNVFAIPINAGSNPGVDFWRSTDFGANFTGGRLFNANFLAARMAVSDDGNTVFVGGLEDAGPGNTDVFILQSTDGGVTFDAPVTVAQDPNFSNLSSLVSSPDGSRLYVTWVDDDPINGEEVFFSVGTATLPTDFGDAPVPYPTTLAEDGARHADTGPTLGLTRDTEADGAHSAAADADGADEDGVTFGTMMVGALDATVTVNVQGSAGKLDAWIDFNGDGSWGGPGEQIFASRDVVVDDNHLTFDVPSYAIAGTTTARFRLSTAGGLGVVGAAADGEVEDYQVTINNPATTTGLFDSQNTIGTATVGPSSLFAADVDADGDLDVLSASFGNAKIAWYENDGSGNFNEHAISTMAIGAFSVFAADVDGDGDLDVLSASANDDKIAWYENDGSQNFSEHAISTTADGALSVFAADIDGDGDLDVLSASLFGNKIAWYENDGSQNFTERTISATAAGPRSVFAADVDRDGDLDVIGALVSDNKVVWYENDGSQNFTEHTISTQADGAWFVFATDLDKDGDLDVLSASILKTQIAWHENDGNQNFTQHTIGIGVSSPTSVFAADMDGDGDLDVLSTSVSDNLIAWYENDGSQNFIQHTISTVAVGQSVLAADVDGDGDLDVLGGGSIGTIAWHENGADDDGDGIMNNIDPLPATFSNDFSDGTTTGTIISRGDQTLHIQDAFNPNDGVLITADSGGGAIRARVSSCGSAAIFTLGAGAQMIETCGSVSIQVVSGPVLATFFADDGTVSTSEVSAGNSLIFEPTTGTFSAPEENVGTVIVLIEGTPLSLDPGATGLLTGIDIKPGSFPNSINLGSNGTIPVAIFSTPTFDATTIDPTTVTLADAQVRLRGKGRPMASAEDVDGDGLLDLVIHVETQALELTETDNQAQLMGRTFDGVSIVGSDTIHVVAALHVAGGPAEGVFVGNGLTHAALDSVVQQSLAHWTAAGVDPHRLDTLTQVDVRIADLSGSLLGIAALNTVWIDRYAAGYGWSVNSGGVDLFSAVTHEFGHVLGFDHDVMSATMGVGVRQLASSRSQMGAGAGDGTGSVHGFGTSARFDGFFSLSRERGLSDLFGTTPFTSLWDDTTVATNQRDRLFAALASVNSQPVGFVGLRNSYVVDAGFSGKDEVSSRRGDLLSFDDLDNLFADYRESLEDEIFRGMTSPE